MNEKIKKEFEKIKKARRHNLELATNDMLLKLEKIDHLKTLIKENNGNITYDNLYQLYGLCKQFIETYEIMQLREEKYISSLYTLENLIEE